MFTKRVAPKAPGVKLRYNVYNDMGVRCLRQDTDLESAKYWRNYLGGGHRRVVALLSDGRRVVIKSV